MGEMRILVKITDDGLDVTCDNQTGRQVEITFADFSRPEFRTQNLVCITGASMDKEISEAREIIARQLKGGAR